jgi:hypothetical protein
MDEKPGVGLTVNSLSHYSDFIHSIILPSCLHLQHAQGSANQPCIFCFKIYRVFLNTKKAYDIKKEKIKECDC